MSLQRAISETFSSQPLRGELTPTGPLDRLAGTALVVAGALYLFMDVLGGPIRALFGSIGLTPLLYAPPAAALAALGINALTRIGDARTAAPVLGVIAFVVIEILIALLLGRSIGAPMFALYITLPVFVMMALTQRHMQNRLINAMVPVFFVATIGVLLNVVVRYPWADVSFEVMGVKTSAAREWTQYGHNRLAGFSRASFVAAGEILICYCAVEHRTKSLGVRALWWALGMVAVYYTTSKTTLFAMAILPLTYIAIGRMRATEGVRWRLLAGLVMTFWVLLIFAGPFLSMTYGPQLYPQGVGTGMGYSSLADRILNTWPNAIGMIDWRNPVSWLVGRGLGGIGAPQTIFEPDIANPGDNMAIYLFVSFGIVAFAIGYMIFRGGLRAIMLGARGRRDFALIVAMLGIAMASNVMESPVQSMIIGLAIARQRSRAGASAETREPAADRERASRSGRRRRSSRRLAAEGTGQ